MYRQDLTHVEMEIRWPGGIGARLLVRAVHIHRESTEDYHRPGEPRPLGATSPPERAHIIVDDPQVVATNNVASLTEKMGPEASASYVLHQVRPHLPKIYWTRYYRHATDCPSCIGVGSGQPEDARAYQHAPNCSGAALAASLDAVQGKGG